MMRNKLRRYESVRVEDLTHKKKRLAALFSLLLL
jgi:hypothetical protein